MTIRWTQPANDDFLGIIAWIAANNPVAASSVGRRILDVVERLDDFPLQGRRGRSPDTRELVISGLPFWSSTASDLSIFERWSSSAYCMGPCCGRYPGPEFWDRHGRPIASIWKQIGHWCPPFRHTGESRCPFLLWVPALEL